MRRKSAHPSIPSTLQHPEACRVAIVRSSYYPELLDSMEEGARRKFRDAGIPDAHIETQIVPGSFEIPLACASIIEKKKVHGIVALGVIIEGETHHAAEIARACTDGLMQVQLNKNIPIAHGVLFVKSLEQAMERAREDHNRGTEAVEALLGMLAVLEIHVQP
jgi:6,7-dimethyl-8-ribityllumazine synthase